MKGYVRLYYALQCIVTDVFDVMAAVWTETQATIMYRGPAVQGSPMNGLLWTKYEF